VWYLFFVFYIIPFLFVLSALCLSHIIVLAILLMVFDWVYYPFCVSLCFSLFLFVSLCFSVFLCVSLCFSLFLCVSLCFQPLLGNSLFLISVIVRYSHDVHVLYIIFNIWFWNYSDIVVLFSFVFHYFMLYYESRTYLKGPSWSWSYGSWIYNYLCNQCISPLPLWVRTPLRRGVLDITLCDQACQWLETGR
jgi:hypothetical protein